MNANNYAVFILTHGRPNNVVTYKTIRKQGYTGKIFLIVDDQDNTRDEYIEKYNDEVILFSKDEVGKTFDLMDSFDNDKVIVYARNVCWQIARKLKLDYFIQFDDDYTKFAILDYKRRKQIKTSQLDWVFNSYLRCLESTKVRTIAFVQAGDLIGGFDSQSCKIKYKRKAMNTFFFKVGTESEDMIFIGRMNEDVNAYLLGGIRGQVFIQAAHVKMDQKATQQNAGGMTGAYNANGTYVKSFYSVINAPSCCKIARMRSHGNERIHHQVAWDNAACKIIRQEYKK